MEDNRNRSTMCNTGPHTEAELRKSILQALFRFDERTVKLQLSKSGFYDIVPCVDDGAWFAQKATFEGAVQAMCTGGTINPGDCVVAYA